jgi:hypothetical protein
MAAASTGRQPRSNTAEELDAPVQAGRELEQLITKQIRNSSSIVDLECVFTEWGGSFNLAHTAHALSKLAKLAHSEETDSAASNSQLRQLLSRKWLRLLPQAGGHQCASALCACGILSEDQVGAVWDPTWAAFMQRVQQRLGEGLVLQDIADVMHASARLRKQPGPGELQLLAHKWLQLLPQAGAHECASAVWACLRLDVEQVNTVWDPTWAAFMQHVQRGLREGLVPLDIADAVRAAATLRKQPGPGDLQLLVQAFLQLEVPTSARARVSARLVNGIETLSQLPGWQGGIHKQDMQQLLLMVQQRRERQAEWVILKQISAAETVAWLQRVCNKSGGGFGIVETSVALGRLAKLSSERHTDGREDIEQYSKERADALWEQLWTGFMQHVQRGLGEGLPLQAIARAVRAAATLCKQPGHGELQLLVQAFLHPGVRFGFLAAEAVEALLAALDQVSHLPGWQGEISKQDMQLLQGVQQLLREQLADQLLTDQISSAKAVEQLQQVCQESGGSFQVIHTAAALYKFSKLAPSRTRQRDSGRDSQVLQLLVRKWLQLLPTAGVRECCNILSSCGRLGQEQADAIWAPTWAAFMQHVQREAGEGLIARDIADAVRAAATLGKQPGRGELQLLVHAFLQPGVLESASELWHVASLRRAIKTLSRLPGSQGGVRKEDWQQLLDRQRLLSEQQAGSAGPAA